jgi:prophage antirepressor-like protein
MKNEITIFNNEDFSIEAIERDGEPWFFAKPLCEQIDLTNVSQAVSRLDDDEKGIYSSDTLGGRQDVSIVNESGLYSLILTSRKPEAKRFKKWITSEVLPAIRKTGSYSVPKLNNQKALAQQLKATVDELLVSLEREEQLQIELNTAVEVIEEKDEVIDTLNEILVNEYGQWCNATKISSILCEKFEVIDGNDTYIFNPSNQDIGNYFRTQEIAYQNGRNIKQDIKNRWPGLFALFPFVGKNNVMGNTLKMNLANEYAMDYLLKMKNSMIDDGIGIKKKPRIKRSGLVF